MNMTKLQTVNIKATCLGLDAKVLIAAQGKSDLKCADP